MLALTRCRVPAEEEASFLAVARETLGLLAQRDGFRRGHIGQAIEDATLWVLSSEWDAVGPYRRGLSAYDVKVAIAPLMPYVVGEPGAYETVAAHEALAGS
ncbi:MAG: antibiotic biosynthesis monooxygenase family protein [Actinomycetes bacterium]